MLGVVLVIFLIVYMAYRNGLIAKLKGKNQVLWVLLTLVAFWMFASLGGFIVLQILISTGQINANDYKAASETADKLNDLLTPFLISNPIHIITIMAFGMGGYLLVRYILEKMPNINIPKDNEGVV
jgi:hypothetical protein